VAADFTKYDEYAVKQINRNIDLIRYRRFGDDLLALDLVWRTTADDIQLPEETAQKTTSNKTTDKPFDKIVEELDQPMRDLYEFLRANILALGDDVSEKRLKLYVAYRRIKTFASVVVQKKQLLIYVQLDPDEVTLEDGFTRDVRKIGHWATGNLVITVTNKEQLNKAQPLIARSYEEA
jgi:predicted transport protein